MINVEELDEYISLKMGKYLKKLLKTEITLPFCQYCGLYCIVAYIIK